MEAVTEYGPPQLDGIDESAGVFPTKTQGTGKIIPDGGISN